MASCVLFGNRNFTGNIADCLDAVARDLITAHAVDTFYVGHHGNFDRDAISYLGRLKRKHPEISYCVVLSRLPCPNWLEGIPTLLPEGIESIPPKYAILYRNDFMLKRADYVVVHQRYKYGGTARMVERARRLKKPIIHLTAPIDLV